MAGGADHLSAAAPWPATSVRGRSAPAARHRRAGWQLDRAGRALPFPACPPSPTPGRSAAARSRTGSCSPRWRASATGSCASRPSASAPGWSSPRWSPASGSPTATSAPSREFLRIHPDEHPVSIQLFGHDPAVMREAAAMVAAAGADLIDLNMGCPVRKVCKTGAGAALLDDPDKAVAIATRGAGGQRPARHRQAAPRPRPGRPRRRRRWRAGSSSDAGVAGIAFHPRHASQQHAGSPDYALARELAEALPVPVILSGGLCDEDRDARRLRARAAPPRSCSRAARSATRGASRACSAATSGEPTRGGGRGRARDGHRRGRGAPRHRPRRPLSAQVLPVVRGHAGPDQARARGARHGARRRPMRGPRWRR